MHSAATECTGHFRENQYTVHVLYVHVVSTTNFEREVTQKHYMNILNYSKLTVSEPFCGYVVVQFYPWFKFYFPLFTIFIIIRYHTQKQMKIKFEPRIKLNHNRYIVLREFSSSAFINKTNETKM